MVIKRKALLAVASLLTLCLVFQPTSYAATLQVCQPAGTCAFDSIQSAIVAASNDDTILVDNGTYWENIDFLDKTIRLASVNGPEHTTIDGAGAGEVVSIRPGSISTINGFTIQNGVRGIIVGSAATIENCIVQNNTMPDPDGLPPFPSGAGIYVGGPLPAGEKTFLLDSIVRNNSTHHGAGIVVSNGSLLMANTLVYKNVATHSSGIYVASTGPSETASIEVYNSTIADNSEGGVAVIVSRDDAKIVNSIIWNNGTEEITGEGDILVNYSNVTGGYPGIGNISLGPDPLFVDSANSDYHLSSNSPCIDKGTSDLTQWPDLPSMDIDGDKRPTGAAHDIGSDEYVEPVPAPQIRANNVRRTLTINKGDELVLTVELDPKDEKGTLSDWWIVARTPFSGEKSWYHFDLAAGWIPGLDITQQAPCVDIQPREVLRMSKLPIGRYIFYFGVDLNANGVLDMSELYYDSVVVNVVKQ